MRLLSLRVRRTTTSPKPLPGCTSFRAFRSSASDDPGCSEFVLLSVEDYHLAKAQAAITAPGHQPRGGQRAAG
jgi:hypothetical protein